MFKKFFLTFIFIVNIICASLYAQEHPTGIKDEILMIRLIPQLFYSSDATDIIQKAIMYRESNSFKQKPYYQYDFYQKTSVDIVVNKDTLNNQLYTSKQKNDFLAQQIIQPFEPWFSFARPTKNSDELALTIFMHEDYKTFYADHLHGKKGSMFHSTRNEGFFESIGRQNIFRVLDEVFGDVDFYREKSNLLMLPFRNPLAKDAPEIYTYRFNGVKQINGVPCFEVVFYSYYQKENAFSGFLYITADGKYALNKAKFTLNNPENTNFLKDILITHTYSLQDSVWAPVEKKSVALLGNQAKGSLMVERNILYSGFSFAEIAAEKHWKEEQEKDYYKKDESYWTDVRPVPLTASQQQLGGLFQMANKTRHFTNLRNLILILLNDHLSIGGVNRVAEIGPLTEMISYNRMEGLRLKLGGNTTLKSTGRFLLGGYLAYGTHDREFKYRGDIIYSFLPRNKSIWEYPKRLLSFTYVSDLNIPGQDVLNNRRDNFIYSLSHIPTDNMSLQRVGLITFEDENKHHFSYKIGGKFMYESPRGVVKYMRTDGLDTTIIRSISTSELSVSLRYAPEEKHIQNRDKRFYMRRGSIELDLNHRTGIKGLFGSDYNYHITEIKGHKKFPLPGNSGSADVRLAAGKIWNRVPFPLLFIPQGNQSYIFGQEEYNLIHFYEFTTDQYMSGNINLMFNWSPFSLFSRKSKINTSIGGRTIYGPISDNNNPELHSELFVFNRGVNPLGNTPYVEVNFGFANIFKLFRIEYVRRLTYLEDQNPEDDQKTNKGSLLVSGSFSF